MKTFLLVVGAALLLALGVGAFATWRAVEGLDPAPLEARYAAGDRFVEVDGVRVRVRIEGPEDGAPIMLLHGFAFSLESWNAWAAELAKTRRVIRYDLAGHGLTGPDPLKRYAPEERAAFHVALMDALGLARADLAGNSLGGLIAWRVAAAHPERVGKLVLVDSGGYPINGVTGKPVEAPPPMKAFLLTAPEAGVAAMFQGLYGDDTKISPARVAETRDMMRRRGNGRALVESIAEFVLPDPKPALAAITAPTLILWGGKDALIPPEHAARFDADIPDSRAVIYEGAGHVPQEEIPSATLADVVAFLDAPAAAEPAP